MVVKSGMGWRTGGSEMKLPEDDLMLGLLIGALGAAFLVVPYIVMLVFDL